MFAGWGFSGLPSFFDNPVRTLFVVLVIFCAMCAVALRIETQPVRKGLLPIGGQGLQLAILLALSLFLLGFLPFADGRHLLTFHFSLARYAGLALCAIGASVRLFAMRRLGRHFSAYVTLQPGHHLEQSGIYRAIRHPLYLSLLLLPLGTALVFASWLALPIFILSVIFVADRIRQEEQLLARQFGAAFFAYRQRTRMLLPGIF